MSDRSESDGWQLGGRNILSKERLTLIRTTLEESPIILEHWFYRAGRGPDRRVLTDFDEFMEYLTGNAQPGDALHVWRFDKLCLDDNTLTDGKYPDTNRMVPKRGAY